MKEDITFVGAAGAVYSYLPPNGFFEEGIEGMRVGDIMAGLKELSS
jgi:hypothetical protein